MEVINILINNKNVRVHTWGDSSNEAIVFLHGLGGASLGCIELAEELQERFYLISIDLPGHGQTEPLSKIGFEIPNLIKWLSSVIKHFINGKHHFIAHSWGADIALNYSIAYPDTVDKIILLDGGYHDKEITNEYFSKLNEKDKTTNRISSMEEEIKYYQNDFDGFTYPTLEEAVEAEFQYYKRPTELLKFALKDLIRFDGKNYRWHANGQTATFALMSMYKYPTRNIYKYLEDNVLLLHCSLDLPGEWTPLRKILINKIKTESNIKTHMINDANHGVHRDNLDEVLTGIFAFLIN